MVRGANNRLADRPDILRTPTLPDNYVDRSPGLGMPWFDPSAFVNPADWTYGNTPRTLRGLLAPGAINLDASLFKNFRVGERARLQFRAEAFNAANHVNPASPNATFANDRASPNNTNATFGRITSARDPRQVQLALKLVF